VATRKGVAFIGRILQGNGGMSTVRAGKGRRSVNALYVGRSFLVRTRRKHAPKNVLILSCQRLRRAADIICGKEAGSGILMDTYI
jgi:hypothetical protein